MINTANSYVNYKTKFNFNVKATALGGNDTTYLEQVPILDPENASQVLVPGRYTVKDNVLWCEPAKVNSLKKFSEFGNF